MRRRLKRLLVALLLAALAAQAPALYRRYRLRQLSGAIAALHAQRALDPDDTLADYAGALHVHTALGGHSTGTLEEVIRGAQAAGLKFVVMSEHPSALYDSAAQTLNGEHGGVLFVAGTETSESAQDRLLTFGGDAGGDDEAAGATSTQEMIDRAKAGGRLVFVAHPETFRGWETARGFDGMEVYNLHADARHARPLWLFLEGLWSYRAYPHLLWTRFSENPNENLRRWDALTRGGARRVVAVAGNDAHQNVGLSLQHLTGKPILRLTLDPYERSFRVVRTHVLVPREQTLNAEALLAALAAGHAYVSFDVLADATGFRFDAAGGAEQKIMGDEIALAGGVRLRATTPVRSRMVLVKDGARYGEAVEGVRHEWVVSQPGAYRVECYLPQLPAPLDQKLWIISNPVYVRP